VAKLKSVVGRVSLSLISFSHKKEFKNPARICGKGDGYTSIGSIVPMERPGYELLTRA